MARPKEIISREFVAKAKRALMGCKRDRLYFRLPAVVKAGDHPITEVAAFFEVSRGTVSRWIKRFGAEGVDGLWPSPEKVDTQLS